MDKLAEFDVELYGVHYNQEYYKGVPFKEVLVCDLRDLERILKYAEGIKPNAVVSDQCDYSHFAQAVITQRFDLKGPLIRQAQISANKFLQRQLAKSQGINVPAFKLVTSADEVQEFAGQYEYPIILKPVDNRGSFGVNKIEREEEIENAFYNSLVNSHSRLLLVEKFIDGYEITVDGYVFENGPASLSLAKKGKVDEKRQVSVDIKYPGELAPGLYSEAMRNNEFVIRKLGYTFGMSHAEYIVNPQGEIYLVEAANRGGGVFTSEIIVPNVSGVDILSRYVMDCLGVPAQSFNYGDIQQNEVILKFFSFAPGKIKAIKGIEKLEANQAVLKYRFAVKPGDEIKIISTDANRHGFVIVKADHNVRGVTQEIIEQIEVEYVNERV